MHRSSEVMEDLGYGSQEKNYHLQHEKLSMTSKSSNSNVPARNRPPLIIPDKMPEEIMGDDHDLIKKILIGHRASGMQWDDYAKKLDDNTRDLLADIFYKCRCNGFFAPQVHGDKVVFRQALKMSATVKKYGELTVGAMEGAYKHDEEEANEDR